MVPKAGVISVGWLDVDHKTFQFSHVVRTSYSLAALSAPPTIDSG